MNTSMLQFSSYPVDNLPIPLQNTLHYNVLYGTSQIMLSYL